MGRMVPGPLSHRPSTAPPLRAGHLGGEDSIYNLQAAYYASDISDLGLKAVAKGCTALR